MIVPMPLIPITTKIDVSSHG